MAMSERLKKALMIFIKQSLAGCALGCNHALIAIEDWHINSYAKTIRVHIGGVAGARERHRQLRKLGEDGSAHGWILALVALAQSQKIEPARLDICQQIGFIGRLEVCGQREPGLQAHVGFRFDAEDLIQTKPLMREILFERKHDRARILAGRFGGGEIKHSFSCASTALRMASVLSCKPRFASCACPVCAFNATTR